MYFPQCAALQAAPLAAGGATGQLTYANFRGQFR